MKKLIAVLLCLGLAGCATNPYQKFYRDMTGGADVTKLRQFEASPEVPMFYSGNNIDEDAQRMKDDGYSVLGYSSFNGANVNQNAAIDVGKKVHAAVIIVYGKYTNTLSGQMPMMLPDNHVITTNSSGMANMSGNINGSAGSASWSGSGNYFGHATTTIYGSQTMYMPYSINRYDYFAGFWIKNKPPALGILPRDLNSDERAKIGTNKGIIADAVIRNSVAYKADLFKGDIVIKINQDDIFSSTNFLELVWKNAGKKVSLTIIRDGKQLIKEVQLSEGKMIQDEKYGNMPERFYIYHSLNTQFHKTAKANYNKIYDNYNKSKEVGLVIEQLANLDIPISKQREIANDVNAVLEKYATKNQYRAIFKDDMPNCNETEDVTDAIILKLNGK